MNLNHLLSKLAHNCYQFENSNTPDWDVERAGEIIEICLAKARGGCKRCFLEDRRLSDKTLKILKYHGLKVELQREEYCISWE